MCPGKCRKPSSFPKIFEIIFFVFHDKQRDNMFLLETGLPLWLSWYRLCLQCGRPGFDPWVRKIPWRRERPPTPVFWPREFHGLYSPRGRKESDSTGRLSLSLSRNRRPSCFCRLHLRQSVLGIMGVGYLMLTLIQRWI